MSKALPFWFNFSSNYPVLLILVLCFLLCCAASSVRRSTAARPLTICSCACRVPPHRCLPLSPPIYFRLVRFAFGFLRGVSCRLSCLVIPPVNLSPCPEAEVIL